MQHKLGQLSDSTNVIHSDQFFSGFLRSAVTAASPDSSEVSEHLFLTWDPEN
jgi:hypothetical protein